MFVLLMREEGGRECVCVDEKGRERERVCV